MNTPKMLSGVELVSKGVTKSFATLPEIGLKDVIPNGSWLEQKQIQAALEARKHLVAVERIEKFGTLSQAEWRDDLRLAEVTRQTGSHWQFFGHSVGKKLYLRPEEALFLIEVNCLQLKHNDVTVSIQKAYSLLLDDKFTINQYKVYASLSRLGYKVFRHRETNTATVSEKKTESVRVTAGSSNNHSTLSIGNISLGNEATNTKDVNNATVNDKITEENIRTEDTVNTTGSSIDTKIIQYTIILDIKGKHHLSVEEKITKAEDDNDKFFFDKNQSKQNTKINDIQSTQDTKEDKNQSIQTNVVEENQSKQLHKEVETQSEDTTNFEENESQQNREINEIEYPSTDKTCDYVNDNSSIDQDIGTNNDTMQNNNLGELNPNSAENDPEKHSSENIEVSQNCEAVRTEKNEKKYNKLLKYEIKLQKLQNRTLEPIKNIHKYFVELPDMSKKDIVSINTPQELNIPRTIFVNKTTYKLNLKSIKAKKSKSSTGSSYSTSDEEDRSFRRIRNTSRNETPQNSNTSGYYQNMRLPRINQQFRPFLFWRPRPHFNFINFNELNPRLFYFQNQFNPRAHFNIRPNPFLTPFADLLDSNNDNDNSLPRPPKRPKNAKQFHLQAIRNLATKVKNHILSGNIVMPGNTHIQTIQALHKLLYAYNLKFNSKVRLTPTFELVDETNVVETIELDGDEEVQAKKPRLEEDTFNENLDKLRQIALKLKNLVVKGVSTSRHRRALSSAIKTFNKSYNADIYLNENYEVLNRRHITLDSSSDTDCVIKENEKQQKRKKLRNPFYILKKRSEKQSNGHASTSKDNSELFDHIPPATGSNNNNCHSGHISAYWLPKDDDFGRVETCTQNGIHTCVINSSDDQLLYDFMKSHAERYGNWLEVKIEFANYLKELNKQYETEHKNIPIVTNENQCGLRPIIAPDDCSDMPTLLDKLRIIKTDKSVIERTNIKVNFDVYNRDVQNFRKTNRPKPHFRIVCYDGSSTLPSGIDVATLHAKYDDGISIVFAIVDIGSISYLQIKPTDIPVYLPTNLQ